MYLYLPAGVVVGVAVPAGDVVCVTLVWILVVVVVVEEAEIAKYLMTKPTYSMLPSETKTIFATLPVEVKLKSWSSGWFVNEQSVYTSSAPTMIVNQYWIGCI